MGRWHGFKHEKFWYHGGSLRNPILGGIQEKLRYIGESHKKGELRQFADLKVGGGYGKKKGWWFWGWVNTQMHIMS